MNPSNDVSCKFVRFIPLRVWKGLEMQHAFWEMLSLAFSPFQDSGVAAGCPPCAGPPGGGDAAVSQQTRHLPSHSFESKGRPRQGANKHDSIRSWLLVAGAQQVTWGQVLQHHTWASAEPLRAAPGWGQARWHWPYLPFSEGRADRLMHLLTSAPLSKDSKKSLKTTL